MGYYLYTLTARWPAVNKTQHAVPQILRELIDASFYWYRDYFRILIKGCWNYSIHGSYSEKIDPKSKHICPELCVPKHITFANKTKPKGKEYSIQSYSKLVDQCLHYLRHYPRHGLHWTTLGPRVITPKNNVGPTYEAIRDIELIKWMNFICIIIYT